jgi:hypothetical protein
MRATCSRPSPSGGLAVKCQVGVKPTTSSGRVGRRSLTVGSDRQTNPRPHRALATTVRAHVAALGDFAEQVVAVPAPVRSFDFLVLGSGIAGLTYAIKVG